MKSGKISGLDIQKEYISIAQYSPEENCVDLVAIQPLPIEKSVDFLQSASDGLKELKGKFKFSKPDVVCSLPSENAIIKHLTVDSNESEPAESIEWELSQQVIGSIEEYSFDFQPVSSNSEEYLAVAYRTKSIDALSSVIKNLKLNPLIIDLDVFALINVFEANYREKISQPAVLIHAEPEKSRLVLTMNGMFIDYETIEYPYGIEADSYAGFIYEEYMKLLALNNGKFPASSEGLYFTGSLFTQPEYSEAVIRRFGMGEELYPFRKIDSRIGVEEAQLKTYASQLAIAVGLALRGNAQNR
jgi:Tfp pilus assembly PilM family ATPase